MPVLLIMALLVASGDFAPGHMQESRKMTNQLDGKYRGLTMANPEHDIIELEEITRVRSVKGRVVRFLDHVPLEDVLIEIKGPGDKPTIRSTRTDRKGNFQIRGVPEGEYRFKATQDGWRSVLGVLLVTKKTNRTGRIELVMQLGT